MLLDEEIQTWLNVIESVNKNLKYYLYLLSHVAWMPEERIQNKVLLYVYQKEG
jgi:hypothetical protein